jgi:hypothetical protein
MMRRDSIAVKIEGRALSNSGSMRCAAPNTDMRIVTTAPLVVVEVLSPEDRIANDRGLHRYGHSWPLGCESGNSQGLGLLQRKLD